MKKTFMFAALFTLSTSAFAGNISSYKSMGPVHNQIHNQKPTENILKDENMQQLHREMTLFGMSEVGMEARRRMIGSDKGRAYHRALDRMEKNTAG